MTAPAKPPKLVYVRPFIPGRMSVTRDEAVALLSHPFVKEMPQYLKDEAKAVIAAGKQIWWNP